MSDELATLSADDERKIEELQKRCPLVKLEATYTKRPGFWRITCRRPDGDQEILINVVSKFLKRSLDDAQNHYSRLTSSGYLKKDEI